MAVNSQVSYTKADCCCLSEPVPREESGTAGLLSLVKGTAERSHERALERRKQAKKCSRGSRQHRAGQELSSLLLARTNKGPTGHTIHSCIKGKAKLERSSEPDREV